MVFVHLRDAGKHADRAGNGSERVADFMSNRGGQPPYRCQTVLHANFALQAANLGEIVEYVDISQLAALRHGQGSHADANRFAEFVGGVEAHLTMILIRLHVGQGIEKQLVDASSKQFRRGAFQQALGCAVDQRDAAVEAGGDQSAADGMDDILVQRLQALQRTASVLELYADLPQFCGEQSRQIGHRQESKKIDEDDGLQRPEAGMRAGIGRNEPEVAQFQNRAVKNERQRRHQLRPHPRQQHAGNNNDERIEEVERAVPASGLVNDEADQNQVGQNLQRGLQSVLAPKRKQEHVKQRKAVPEKNGAEEEPHGKRRGTEPSNRQFNAEQQGQDKNSYPNQPHQPIALVKGRLHGEISMFQGCNVSRFQSCKGSRL